MSGTGRNWERVHKARAADRPATIVPSQRERVAPPMPRNIMLRPVQERPMRRVKDAA